MGGIVGSQKQEQKVEEMGSIANRLHPDLSVLVFKGTFRLGVQSALKKSSFKDWEEVSKQSVNIRSDFFEKILDESRPRLQKVGLSEKEISNLFNILRFENRKYLRN